MNQAQWTAIDDYFAKHYIGDDPVLDATLASQQAGGLPDINVSPNQGKLLMVLAQLVGAKRVLEIGTLGGYSTIWLARALPNDGKIITLEFDAVHAEVARGNIANAGFAEMVEVREGAALELLPVIDNEAGGPFDLFFIDADKVNNPLYMQWALKLSRIGSLIIVDNVVRGGEVLNADSDDVDVQGTRRVHELLANEPRLMSVALQTVGAKGWDGLAIARVVS